MTESENLVIKRFNPEIKAKYSFIKLFYNHTTTLELLLYIFGMCCSIFAGVCLIQNLGLINDFVALLTAEMSNDEKISEFKKIFLKEIYWGIGTFFLEWIMGFSFEYVSYKVMIRIKISYLRILFSMDKIWFDNLDKTINELISDVEREISIIYSSLGIEVANILKLLTTIIYCIVKGFQINVITTLIKFVFLIAFIACIIILVIIMIKESNKKKKAYDIQGAYLSSIIKNIKGIVGFGNFDYEEKLFKEEIEKSNKIFKSYNWKTSLTNAFEDFIMDFSMATNNALIGHYIYENLVNEKNYNIDNIFTAAGAMDGLGQYFGELIPNTRQLVKCIDISKFYLNLKQYYLEKYNLDDEKNDLIFKEIEIEDEKSQDINDIQGKISFKNVKFSYCKENTSLMDINYILKDFNVDFEAKKITVISGESGSGKSTIINLIEKIYDVDEGQILIDDKYVLNDILSKEVKNKTHNIPFSLEDYRNIIGYVPQEPILCNDTIRTNILYGRNGISDEKIWEVLKKVNLYGFVKRLDNKLDYLVGNKGSKLSGGQKQRICIARALVNDPKILILDEATSSLDKINENQILELLEGLRDKVSIIFITHKPDILTIADQILYVKKGGLYEVKNQNVNEKKNKVQVIEHEMDYFDEEKIEINQNQKKNEKTSSVIDFILSMGSYKYLFFLAVFLSAAKGGISDVIFFYYSDCLGSYYEQTEGEKLKKEIVIYTIKPTIFSILAFICGFFDRYIFEYIGEKLSSKYKLTTFTKMMRMHMSFFDLRENSPGKLSESIIEKTKSINGVIFNFLSKMSEFIGLYVGEIILCFTISWEITLWFIAVAVIISLISILYVYFSSKAEILISSSQFGEILSDNLHNYITLNAYNAQNFWVNQLTIESKEMHKSILTYLIIVWFSNAFMLFWYYFFTGFLIYYTGKNYVNEKLTYDQVLNAFYGIATSLPLYVYILRYIKNISKMKESINALYKLTNLQTEINPEIECQYDYNNLSGKIEFNNVSFCYPINPSYHVLNNISLTIEPGDKIAIVGESGCGKSTFTQLIERFYDVSNGEILIDGIDIKNHNLKQLRKSIGYIQQDPLIFERNNYENILYGNLDSSRDDVEKAAKMCNIENKIDDSYIALSGGEKQRICIARALIKKPKILILDESTSSLDDKNVGEIQKNLDQIIKEFNCTIIMIEHKKNMLKLCNKFIFLNDGKIENKDKDEILNL
jgi:ATP-binding cassette subfamily B (MDR/TAP) protein 1